MSSAFPRVLICAAVVALAACEREDRQSRLLHVPPMDSGSPPLTGDILYASERGHPFERNAYHVSEGKRLYRWFNCVGCHAQGGGGMGPALMDGHWVYGESIEDIAATIRDGRPNGMPAFRDQIVEMQIWQLAAYVRAVGGKVRSDVAPSRGDSMRGPPPENRRSGQPQPAPSSRDSSKK